MQQSKDPRLKILIATTIVLVLGGIIGGIISLNNSNNNIGDIAYAKMKVNQNKYDFGNVSMADGLAKHIFEIKNEGNGNLKISNIKTSCMCTTAVLEVNGEKSPKFSMHNNPILWSKELKPGETANLEVAFDPNAHGPEAVGPVTRTITMHSNNGGQENVKTIFTFTANVIR